MKTPTEHEQAALEWWLEYAEGFLRRQGKLPCRDITLGFISGNYCGNIALNRRGPGNYYLLKHWKEIPLKAGDIDAAVAEIARRYKKGRFEWRELAKI